MRVQGDRCPVTPPPLPAAPPHPGLHIAWHWASPPVESSIPSTVGAAVFVLPNSLPFHSLPRRSVYFGAPLHHGARASREKENISPTSNAVTRPLDAAGGGKKRGEKKDKKKRGGGIGRRNGQTSSEPPAGYQPRRSNIGQNLLDPYFCSNKPVREVTSWPVGFWISLL